MRIGSAETAPGDDPDCREDRDDAGSLHRGHPLRPLVSGWERVRSVRRLELPRFSREETAEQLEAILGAPPESSMLELLYERSEGNAFLSEEILGALQEGASRDGLPVTLRDVLLARAERLPASTLRLLRVASAAGPSVPDRLLSVVSDLDEPSLDAALREAVEHHLPVVDDAGEGYRFRHALTRDAIYGDALPRERVVTSSRRRWRDVGWIWPRRWGSHDMSMADRTRRPEFEDIVARDATHTRPEDKPRPWLARDGATEPIPLGWSCFTHGYSQPAGPRVILPVRLRSTGLALASRCDHAASA